MRNNEGGSFIEGALREALRKADVAVKICGVTNPEEAREIVDAGADFIGLNFYSGSPRFLGEPCNHPWVKELSTLRVGIFVNAPMDEILKFWSDGWIDVAQLHGDETPGDVAELKRAGLPILKAIGLASRATIEILGSYNADAILLDAPAGHERGGTGRRIDWALAREAVGRYPHLPIILAGGLTDDNVSEAVKTVRPAGVDVASGVERFPGHKDLCKVRRFIAEARKG